LVNLKAFIHQIEAALALPLPGSEAQLRMAPPARRHFQPEPANALPAGVLVLFFPKGNQWNLVLIERKDGNPADRHRGQVSFPGGKVDARDASPAHAALREAQEEVGVHPADICMLGKLTELYIAVSNFKVHPYVGCLDYVPEFRPQEAEVAAILEVPFEHLRQAGTVKQQDLRISQHITLREIPYFDVEGKMVWGATAMILSELLAIAP
jgi:8-oxo-dGTP pyrophosphatase MutT (NUDIX family)